VLIREELPYLGLHLFAGTTRGAVFTAEVSHQINRFLELMKGESFNIRRKFLRDQVDILQSTSSIKCHQSGINGLDVFQKGTMSCFCFHQLNTNMTNCGIGGDIHVASCGDDNSIAISVLRNGKVMQLVAHHPNAHGASVTSIRWIDEISLVSVSTEQRICKWKLQSDKVNSTLILQAGEHLDIADISCLSILRYLSSFPPSDHTANLTP
jgi:WD40 repeat protein